MTEESAHPTRTEYVVSALRERILGGQVKGGEPIRQIAVARELGVSQIPVREALLRLAAEGLVDFIPHRGAVAMALTEKEVRELTHLRVLVETDLLRAAVPCLKTGHLREASLVLDEFDALLQAGTEIARWSELNHRFHAALYQAADRPISLDLVAKLHRQSDRYIRLQLLLTDWIPQAEIEHRQLLKLCSEGRTEDAVQLTARHVGQAGEAIASLLAQDPA